MIIKINQKGYSNILSSSFNPYYSYSYYIEDIYINNIKQKTIKKKYNLNETRNTIKIIWNNELRSTYSMFSSCENIVEIDLANFDSSQITNMNNMFYRCSSLDSLNITHLDTSSVTTMEYMFSGCSKL